MPEENRKVVSVVVSDRSGESTSGRRPNEPLSCRLRRAARGMAACAVALGMSAMIAVADDVRWINPSGGNFGEPANWDAGRVPGSGDHAIIELEGTYTVNLDADATIGGLTLGGQSGTQTLATDIPRTVTLGNHPVLIRETGVLRHRGLVNQLSQFDNHGLIVLRNARLNGEGLIYYTLELVNHPGATIRAERSTRIDGNVLNNGLIQIEDAAPDTYVAFESDGLIVNRGLIAVGQGGGGRRNVEARIENEATGVIRTTTSVVFEEDIVNHGTIEALEGQLDCATLITDGAVSVLPEATMVVAGLMYNGGAFGGPSSTITLIWDYPHRHDLNQNLVVLPTANLVLRGSVFNASAAGRIDNRGTLTVEHAHNFKLTNRSGALALFYNRARPCGVINEPDATIRIAQREGYGNFDFWGGFTNEGFVEVTSEVPGGEVDWSCSGSLANSGLIAFTAGAGSVTYSLEASAVENRAAGRIEIDAETDIRAESVTNAGEWRTGSAVGRVDIVGNYRQEPEGSLHLNVAGRGPDEYDQLAVTGSAVLGGAIEISLAGGFEPTPGDRFAVVTTAASVNGRFDEAVLPCLAPTGRMDIFYSPAEVTLTVEPPLTGDLNCDCTADAFDIEPFVLALTDPGGYGAAYPDCDINLADLNGDGRVDAADIEPFIERLLE